MNFNSIVFFVFFGFVLILHYALPWKIGRWIMVAASYVFYSTANPWYCFLLLFSTTIDFVVAHAIPGARSEARRKALLMVSLVGNLGLLALFKYADFSIATANGILSEFSQKTIPSLHLILPVGISFYTFQTLSYTIDVYRGKIAPTRDFGSFALYVSFFPQLIAGPIERASALLPQLGQKQRATHDDFAYGFQRILWGLVKKMVVADRLGIMVNEIYAQPAGVGAPILFLAVMCFAFQLYLDFSAYTDIAIGCAQMLGIKLSENFQWPFLATNPAAFWGRWHMTLTRWFRDYVYEPMGGTVRSRPGKTFFNTVAVMTLVGLWHGASWNFVCFGFLSGIMVAAYNYYRLYMRSRHLKSSHGSSWGNRYLSISATFVFHFMFLAVFFRSPDMHTAWLMLSGFFSNEWTWDAKYNIYLVMVAALWVIHGMRGTYFSERGTINLSPFARAGFWTILILLLVFGSVEDTEKFIYFQF